MALSENEGKAAVSPLDAERERLRKAGYTDTEISQILIARELGTAHASEPGGHGAMTGVASNLAAAGSYARNFIPSLAVNLATIRNPQAPPTSRGEAALAFIFKIVVVAVIAYVVWQEFSQLRSMTARSSAEACIARQKLLLDTAPSVENPKSPYYQQWLRENDEFERDCVGSR